MHVKPPCDCVANVVSSWYKHREIVSQGVDFDYDGIGEGRGGGGSGFTSDEFKGAAGEFFFFVFTFCVLYDTTFFVGSIKKKMLTS